MDFWKSSARDKIRNGIFAGGLVGVAIWQGAHIYSWLLLNLPNTWFKLGEYSLPIYLIIAGMIIGGIIDKY